MEQRHKRAKQPMYLGILTFFVVGQNWKMCVCAGGTLGAEIGNVKVDCIQQVSRWSCKEMGSHRWLLVGPWHDF